VDQKPHRGLARGVSRAVDYQLVGVLTTWRTLFYVPLCLRYYERKIPAAAEHEASEKPEAGEKSKVAL